MIDHAESGSAQQHRPGLARLSVDRSIYSIDAILRATYKITDRCYVALNSSTSAQDFLTVSLWPKDPQSAVDIEGEFWNELLDQQLRARLDVQFGELRSLIVAQAFSEGNLLDTPTSDNDYLSDSRGIAGPPR